MWELTIFREAGWSTCCNFSKSDQLFSYILHVIHKNIVGLKVSFDTKKKKTILDKRLENVDVKYTVLMILHLGLPFLGKS